MNLKLRLSSPTISRWFRGRKSRIRLSSAQSVTVTQTAFPGRHFLLFPCQKAKPFLSEIQTCKRIIYIQRDDPSFSALQVMGITRCSATCVGGLFYPKTCEQHSSCFQAGRHYSHFHQHSCSGNAPSGSLISGLISLRAPPTRLATDVRCRLSEAGTAHLSPATGDRRMTLIKVIDV